MAFHRIGVLDIRKLSPAVCLSADDAHSVFLSLVSFIFHILGSWSICLPLIRASYSRTHDFVISLPTCFVQYQPRCHKAQQRPLPWGAAPANTSSTHQCKPLGCSQCVVNLTNPRHGEIMIPTPKPPPRANCRLKTSRLHGNARSGRAGELCRLIVVSPGQRDYAPPNRYPLSRTDDLTFCPCPASTYKLLLVIIGSSLQLIPNGGVLLLNRLGSAGATCHPYRAVQL